MQESTEKYGSMITGQEKNFSDGVKAHKGIMHKGIMHMP